MLLIGVIKLLMKGQGWYRLRCYMSRLMPWWRVGLHLREPIVLTTVLALYGSDILHDTLAQTL
jgi:hypothetical protein